MKLREKLKEWKTELENKPEDEHILVTHQVASDILDLILNEKNLFGKSLTITYFGVSGCYMWMRILYGTTSLKREDYSFAGIMIIFGLAVYSMTSLNSSNRE